MNSIPREGNLKSVKKGKVVQEISYRGTLSEANRKILDMSVDIKILAET